jgi:hypothetical protein
VLTTLALLRWGPPRGCPEIQVKLIRIGEIRSLDTRVVFLKWNTAALYWPG